MSTVKIKSGDTAIEFTDTLTKDGVAVDLTDSDVLFLLKLKTSPFTAYSLTAEIVDALLGTVKYSVDVGFPTYVGEYHQEWEVTFSDDTIRTFPSSGYNTVKILDDLN